MHVSWRLGISVFAVLSSLLFLSKDSDRSLAMPIIANESVEETTGDYPAGTLRDREPFTCPNDVKELTSLLLKDLPSYSNRVIQRTQDINQDAGIENYIITASVAEFEPLNLPRLQYNQIDDRDPEQVFFTVLERQYIKGEIVNISTYHWLFLANTDSSWRTVMLFSRFGNSQGLVPPAPPRETTNGIIGRGVQLWLRDCRAGTVR